MISALPGITEAKPGSAQTPIPGIVIDVLGDDGTRVDPPHGGDVRRRPGQHPRPDDHRPSGPELAQPGGDAGADLGVDEVRHGAAPAGVRRPFQRRQPWRTSLATT